MGGPENYLSSCLSQFESRLDKPNVSALAGPISASYLLSRAGDFLGWLGRTFGPVDFSHHFFVAIALGLTFTLPYVVLAWRGPAKDVAQPYIAASVVYLLMLFILLPPENQRYFLPLSLIVGWSVPGLFTLPHKPLQRVCFALIAAPLVASLILVRTLSYPPPTVAALIWVMSNRPDAVLYTRELQMHAKFYWPEGDVRSMPKRPDQCESLFRTRRPILTTSESVCGTAGRKILIFERDERVNAKRHKVVLFELP
jgi:hypothetical protein